MNEMPFICQLLSKHKYKTDSSECDRQDRCFPKEDSHQELKKCSAGDVSFKQVMWGPLGEAEKDSGIGGNRPAHCLTCKGVSGLTRSQGGNLFWVKTLSSAH